MFWYLVNGDHVGIPGVQFGSLDVYFYHFTQITVLFLFELVYDH